MEKLNLKNILWKEGKYYAAQCLNVDVSSFGKTKAEAVKNLKEALDLYFEDKYLGRLMRIVEKEPNFSLKKAKTMLR